MDLLPTQAQFFGLIPLPRLENLYEANDSHILPSNKVITLLKISLTFGL